MKPVYIYAATVNRVIDGDSVEVTADLGFDIIWQKKAVRLAHINAPELNSREGVLAKQNLEKLLSIGRQGTVFAVVIKTFKPMDKYGRWLAEIYIDDLNINDQMVRDGHAVPYEGGARALPENDL